MPYRKNSPCNQIRLQYFLLKEKCKILFVGDIVLGFSKFFTYLIRFWIWPIKSSAPCKKLTFSQRKKMYKIRPPYDSTMHETFSFVLWAKLTLFLFGLMTLLCIMGSWSACVNSPLPAYNHTRSNHHWWLNKICHGRRQRNCILPKYSPLIKTHQQAP